MGYGHSASVLSSLGEYGMGYFSVIGSGSVGQVDAFGSLWFVWIEGREGE